VIRTDFFRKREDGVDLYRTYSDANVMIRKTGTEEIYSEAIDVENSGFSYTETDIPIEEESEEATIEDYQNALKELGVSIDD